MMTRRVSTLSVSGAKFLSGLYLPAERFHRVHVRQSAVSGAIYCQYTIRRPQGRQHRGGSEGRLKKVEEYLGVLGWGRRRARLKG